MDHQYRQRLKEEYVARQRSNDDAAARLIMPDIVWLGPLGEGSFGSVRLIRNHKTNEEYAVKIVYLEDYKLWRVAKYKEEFKLQKKCFSKNIVKCHQFFHCGNHLYARLELCDSSLRDRMDKLNGEQMPLMELLRTMKGIAKGLERLHGLQIVHRDLKPENVLLKNGVAKIGDLGLAVTIDPRIGFTEGYVGTPGYYAQEIVNDLRYSYGVDVWVYGIILYELLTSTHPFLPIKTSTERIRRGSFYQLQPSDFIEKGEDRIYTELVQLTNKCMQYDPVFRSNSTQCVVKIQQCIAHFNGHEELEME